MDPNLDDMLTERAQYLKLGNLVQLEAMELSYYKLYKALQEGNEEEALKQYSTYLETQDNVELQVSVVALSLDFRHISWILTALCTFIRPKSCCRLARV